jgi:hypothetical protein
MIEKPDMFNKIINDSLAMHHHFDALSPAVQVGLIAEIGSAAAQVAGQFTEVLATAQSLLPEEPE